MAAWINGIPKWVRGLFVIAGALMSAFSGRFPEAWQDAGLLLGFAILIIALLSLLFAKRAAITDVYPLFPDLRIRDVYFHIHPEVLDDNRWTPIGDDIQSKLSTGALQAWGQLDDSGQLRPLTPIPREFWEKAEILDNFFLEGSRTEELVHAQRYDKASGERTSYRNVMFNRDEVLRTWGSKWPLDASDHSIWWLFAAISAMVAIGAASIAVPQFFEWWNP